MRARTPIEWTDTVWNPVTGCDKVSAGCRNCYAESMAHRFWGARPFTEVRCHPERLELPLSWKKPRRVFVNSMSDLFHEDVSNEYIVAVFGVMAVRPDHTFQVLTKRPARMRAWFHWLGERGGLGRYIRSIRPDGDRTVPNFFDKASRTEGVNDKKHRAFHDPWISVFNAASFHMVDGRLGNVWLGVSIEDQLTADERIPILLQTPAARRFVSAEPLLGPVDLTNWLFSCDGDCDQPAHSPLPTLDWVIVGGESGPQARECRIEWIRSIVMQCRAALIPAFVKQLGSRPWSGLTNDVMYITDPKGGNPSEWPADLRRREWPR